jgi:hypothetical protein
MSSDEVAIAEIAAGYTDDIFLGLDRGTAARDRGVLSGGQIIDVQFTSFMTDPLKVIGTIYTALGRELHGDTERAMREFLTVNPGDGGGGGARYRFTDTGLGEADLRRRATDYQKRFGVASEPVV